MTVADDDVTSMLTPPESESPARLHAAASEADAVFSGEAAGDNSGWSTSGGGDVDGDGIDDFLIGARFESTGATDAGAVYLIEGHSN